MSCGNITEQMLLTKRGVSGLAGTAAAATLAVRKILRFTPTV